MDKCTKSLTKINLSVFRRPVKMQWSCLILAALILVSIMIVCIMVKFAIVHHTDTKTLEDLPEYAPLRFAKNMGLITLSEKGSLNNSQRFPYVAAITRNATRAWEFACFASVILVKWVVTSAHCRRTGSTHRVFLYNDYVRNITVTYPIMLWRLHELYNASIPSPKYDIAVAKLNLANTKEFTLKSANVDEYEVTTIEASVWKTVSTMDKKLYLTNDFEKIPVLLASAANCYESYGIYLDESMFCVDMSEHEECFINEFGPIYTGDKLVGIIAVKPRDCDMKLAIFTNVSYYTNWILRTTRTVQIT